MRRKTRLSWALTAAIVLAAGAPAGASSFARLGLEDLVAGNGLVVMGEVLSTRSYWNEPGTLILTEARVSVTEVLKGRWNDPEITVTLPGGTVGDESITVIGGAELVPGSSYVLFLRKGNLPGVRGVHAVRDHSQGVFEIQLGRDGLRAVSQAAKMELLPDVFGEAAAPGGDPGLDLRVLRRSVRDLAARTAGTEVKP